MMVHDKIVQAFIAAVAIYIKAKSIDYRLTQIRREKIEAAKGFNGPFADLAEEQFNTLENEEVKLMGERKTLFK